MSRTPDAEPSRSCARTAILRASSRVTSTPWRRPSTSYSRNSRRRRAGSGDRLRRRRARARPGRPGLRRRRDRPRGARRRDLPPDDDRGFDEPGRSTPSSPASRSTTSTTSAPRSTSSSVSCAAADPQRVRVGPSEPMTPEWEEEHEGCTATARCGPSSTRASRRFFEWRPYPVDGEEVPGLGFATSAFRASARSGQPGRVRHPAGLDRLDHGTGVERDPPELDVDSRAVDGEHRILRVRVGAEALLRLVVVVREADAARVHVVAVTEAARPLLVRMSTGEHRRVDVGEGLAKHLLVHPRADDPRRATAATRGRRAASHRR